MRAFQITVLCLLLLAGAVGGWYFYRDEPPLKIAVIVDDIAEYRLLSAGIETQLRKALQYWQRDYQLTLLPYAHDPKALAEHFPDVTQLDIVIGCVDSPCVRQVLALIDNTPVAFFYPGHSEGLVRHAQFWHLGAISNQLIIPALARAVAKGNSDVYFVGQESVQARMQAEQLQEYTGLLNATWQEHLFIRADSDWQNLKSDLSTRHPSVLINAQCGLNGMRLYEQINRRDVGLIINTCLNEHEAALLGTHASGDWFLSIYQPAADGLSQQEKLTALAVDLLRLLHGQSFKASYLSSQLRNQSVLQGSDISVVDNDNQHVWHGLYIYSLDKQSKIQTLFAQPVPQRPELVPSQRSPSQWELDALIYWRNRGGKWRE